MPDNPTQKPMTVLDLIQWLSDKPLDMPVMVTNTSARQAQNLYVWHPCDPMIAPVSTFTDEFNGRPRHIMNDISDRPTVPSVVLAPNMR